MRRAWGWLTRRRASPAESTCYYCGTTSLLVPPYGDTSDLPSCYAADVATQVSAGTRTRWYCSVCQAWNLADTQGHVLDTYEPVILDTPSHAVRTSASSDTPVFCRTCLANQTLVTNLLASYLSDDDPSTDESRMAAYPAYRASLEQRYPMVCAQCQPRVDARLRQTEQQWQSAALGAWVDQTQTQVRAAKPVSLPVWHRLRHGLVVMGAWTSYLAGLAVLWLVWDGTLQRPWPWLAGLSCVPIWYDARPTSTASPWPWRIVWCSAWAARLLVYCHAYVVPLPPRTWHMVRIGAWLLQSQLVPLMWTQRYTMRHTQPWLRRVPNATSTSATSMQTTSTDPLAAMSLHETIPAPPPPLDTLLQDTTAAVAADDDDEAMDIEPEQREKPTWVMGPQRFSGPTDSGLEELFGRALHLDAPRATSSWTVETRRWATLPAPVWLGLGAAVVYAMYVSWS